MTVHNLYLYHCINDSYKILKFRTPISIYSLFRLSGRLGKETLIITPKPSDSYTYRAGKIWNIVRQKFNINDFSIATSFVKNSLKKAIFYTQRQGEFDKWNKDINYLIHAYRDAPTYSPTCT